MEQNKKELLMEQVDKINEVISTLSENFVHEDIADEVNFLSVVSSNLKDWVKKGAMMRKARLYA